MHGNSNIEINLAQSVRKTVRRCNAQSYRRTPSSSIKTLLVYCRFRRLLKYQRCKSASPTSHHRFHRYSLYWSTIIQQLLTLWSRVLPEKLTVPHLVKKFPAFYGTQTSIHIQKSPPPVPIPCHTGPVHVPSLVLKIHFNLLAPKFGI